MLNASDRARKTKHTNASAASIPQKLKAIGPSIEKSWNGRITSQTSRPPATLRPSAIMRKMFVIWFVIGLRPLCYHRAPSGGSVD